MENKSKLKEVRSKLSKKCGDVDKLLDNKNKTNITNTFKTVTKI